MSDEETQLLVEDLQRRVAELEAYYEISKREMERIEDLVCDYIRKQCENN